MKNFIFCALFLFLFYHAPGEASAIENPLAKPNNKIGIHLLFPAELAEARSLVNSNGGEWGYIVIPIQSSDRNIEKWQEFMDRCREYKLIPILRLATDGDYFNTAVWRKPREEDLLDFANFLNSLDWPVKNRYILVFNEVNRDDEWGGKADPSEYARLLSYGTTVFKSLNTDFFIISSGMDNASINGNGAINQFDYMRRMDRAVPGIFNQIDGISSHAYPNPNFSSHPLATHQMSIASFRFERSLALSLSNKEQMPVFITETGWSSEGITEEQLAGYYDIAFSEVWSDPGIVAITPFLLNAGIGPFQKFSFITQNGLYTKYYETVKALKKTRGEPTVAHEVLGIDDKIASSSLMPKVFVKEEQKSYFSKSEVIMKTLKFFFSL